MKTKIIDRTTKENVKRLPSSSATGKSTVPRKGSRKEPRLDSVPPGLFGSSSSSKAAKQSDGQKGSPPSKPSHGKLPLESSQVICQPSTERRPEMNIYDMLCEAYHIICCLGNMLRWFSNEATGRDADHSRGNIIPVVLQRTK